MSSRGSDVQYGILKALDRLMELGVQERAWLFQVATNRLNELKGETENERHIKT